MTEPAHSASAGDVQSPREVVGTEAVVQSIVGGPTAPPHGPPTTASSPGDALPGPVVPAALPARKDFWDRLGVIAGLVGGIIVPLIVFWFATRIDNQVKETLGGATLRVQRSTLVTSLIPYIADGTAAKKRFAFETLLAAYPATDIGDATPLLTQIYLLEPDPNVQKDFYQRLVESHIIKASLVPLASAASAPGATLPAASSPAATAPTPLEKRSGSKPSGLGNAFSEPYELCSDPIPAGTRITRAEFLLVGDRTCGGWSTCTQTRNDAAKVCWTFTLQGHDEWLTPRPAYSEGVLRYYIKDVLPF